MTSSVISDARPQSRLGWLDALRGIAALVVVYEHTLDPLYPELRGVTGPWFDAGMYGVMVFFLVSGYVIPASLERRGSVSGFWIGRVFRLYPLWAVVVTAALLLAAAGLDPLHRLLTDRPASAILGHLTMLQDLLDVPNVINVLWTLSYEMAFYLLVTALYWQSLIILATMFAGTALYRAGSGQISRSRAFALAGSVPVAAVGAGIWHGQGLPWAWVITVVAAWATFAAGMLLAERRVPAVWAWLGTVSYSVYLIHPVLLEVVDGLLADPASVAWPYRVGLGVVTLAVLLGSAAVTYRLVEAPAQRVGRRLVARAR
jgi:peptidoglycan/LPS O-acetylase OafA/YrhL